MTDRRHYRASGKAIPCKPYTKARSVTDVAQVTCPACLRWISRTATAELAGQRDAKTPAGLRRRVRAS